MVALCCVPLDCLPPAPTASAAACRRLVPLRGGIGKEGTEMEHLVPFVETLTYRREIRAELILWSAASRGDLDTLSRIVMEDVDVDAPDPGQFRDTAMHKAARSGHARCVEVLIEAGAQVQSLGCIPAQWG